MKMAQLLASTSHRPWPMPKAPWKYYQEWNRALFLHWQVDINALRKLVPAELEIDLFKGIPWVSIVAFSMEKIRPRNLPVFPPISNFDEINIRTYVKFGGKKGVYFLSIEGGSNLSCRLAKAISGLPYRYSDMWRAAKRYHSHNKVFGDVFEANYKVGKDLKKKVESDLWLTERYALYQETEDSIIEFEIQHKEWPLEEVSFEKLIVNYPRFAHLFGGAPDKVGYSNGVQVVAWGGRPTPRLIGKS